VERSIAISMETAGPMGSYLEAHEDGSTMRKGLHHPYNL
jgi:hypothetical protein